MKPNYSNNYFRSQITLPVFWRWYITCILTIALTITCAAQPSYRPALNNFANNTNDTTFDNKDPEIEYEEMSVTLYMSQVGSIEIPAIIYEKKVLLSITDVFDFLKIRNEVSAGNENISGFFVDPANEYVIDNVNNKIVLRDKVFKLKSTDIVRKGILLFLDADKLEQVFGISCLFNFRNLSVTLTSKIIVPVVKEMQLQVMRQNLKQFKREIKADTFITRKFSLLRLGMADWSAGSTQQSDGRTYTNAGVRIGATLAGGELDLSLNYNNQIPFSQKQQFYQWRYVNNSNQFVKQITAGKIFVPSIASLYAPVKGFSISNIATSYKHSFGTYTLSNTTGPNWTVELYMNNVLIDYTKADASGFYTFEVPMVFGSSVVKLRFYGPWGEEQTSEKYINIPFNFTSLHQLEYSITAGRVDNDEKALYARTALNYGLNQYTTIGGGVEYLSSLTSGKYMPFATISARLGQHALFSGEYVYGVRSKAMLNFRLPSAIQLDLNYVHYNKEQKAVKFSYFQEKKIALTLPFKGRRSTIFSRFSFARLTTGYPEFYKKSKTEVSVAEGLVSAVFSGISTTLITTVNSGNYGNPLVYSNLALTFRFPWGIRLTPQAIYDHTGRNFSMAKVEIEKPVFKKGFVNLSYQKYFDNKNLNGVSLGLRYDFSFAQTFFSATKTSGTTITSQSARGSLIYDDQTHYLKVKAQSSVGKGGIIVSPFLDLNFNGLHDAGEPKVTGLDLRVQGGRVVHNKKDTAIMITELEAFTNYVLELDKTNFEHVAWQLKKRVINVDIAPNVLTLLEVPVTIAGEVTGTVLFDNKKQQSGIGRIIVNIYDNKQQLVGRTISEGDGYFSFSGLAPGNYTAAIDGAQMEKIKMTHSSPLKFCIKTKTDGDVADGLKFILNDIDISKN